MASCPTCGNPLPSPGNCPYCGQSAAGPRARSPLKVVNIKGDLPDRELALERLSAALASARREGVVVLKLVHGYGSGGVGGTLRELLRGRLHQLQSEGRVALVLPGEQFSGAEARGRRLLQALPALDEDRDKERANPGITLVLL